MIQHDNSGISLALSKTAKHKCRAPPKFKQRLNIVIHGRKDLVMMHPTLAAHNASAWQQCSQVVRLFEKVMTKHKSKWIVPSQREVVICRGARAQVFKIEVNEILRHAPFSFTSRPSVINISMLNTIVAVPKRKCKGYDSIGRFCLIICKLFSFCSLGLGIRITALFSCDGEWINTCPENNPLSMEGTDYLLSFHEWSRHTKRIFIWSF